MILIIFTGGQTWLWWKLYDPDCDILAFMEVWEMFVIVVVMAKSVILMVMVTTMLNQVILDQLKNGVSRRRVGLLSKGPFFNLPQHFKNKKRCKNTPSQAENLHDPIVRCSCARLNRGDQPRRRPGFIIVSSKTINIYHCSSVNHHSQSIVIITLITWNMVMIVKWRLE